MFLRGLWFCCILIESFIAINRFSLDGLWYLATAMKLSESKYYWVTYKGWGNSELREEQDIDIISPQAEEMFQANQYRGISTPQKQKIFKCLPKKIERM